MFRALATAVNSEGFTDTSDFNKQQKVTFDAPLLTVDKNPIMRTTTGSGAIDSVTPLGSVDPTTRQMTMRDAQLMNYLTDVKIPNNLLDAQAKCKTASLDSLIQNQSLTSAVRCGWIYKKDTTGSAPAVSTGFLGRRKGPETFFPEKPPAGKWYWNLDNAKKDMLKDRCAGLTTCDNVGAENYKGCAFSTTLGSGVPVNSKGTLLYPDDPTASAPPSSLVLTANKCPPPPPPGTPAYELARSRDVCTPLPNGSLSRDCMLQQLTAAGCKQDGTLYNSLVNQAQPNNYAAGLQNTASFKKYQQLTQMPLLDGVVRTGTATTWLALLNFMQLAGQSAIVTNDPLNIAARDLCLQKGLMDSYDFCNDLKDTTPGPFVLECLQKAWIKAGGTAAGTLYPTKSNNQVARFNSYYKTWGAYKADLQRAATNCRSSNEKVQNKALLEFMGIKRETPVGIQIPPIQGTEVFWFNNANNSFIGRRITLANPSVPWFNLYQTNVENTGLSVLVEYYSLTNLRPPSRVDIRLGITTDDGMIYSVGKSIDGNKSRGQGFNDETTLGANWDQAPTTYMALKCWTLQGKGPNYFNGYWRQTFGQSLSAIQYMPCKGGSWSQIPSEWMTLTQEPNAPMLSWEGMSEKGSAFFVERRFPSLMELVKDSKTIIKQNPNSKLNYPNVLKLRQVGSGYAYVKRNISTNSWRTLTLSFLANSANQGVLLAFGPLSILQVGSSIRFVWSSATLTVDTTFDNVLATDGVRPNYVMVNMRSAYESMYPNVLSVYAGQFGPVTDSSIRKFTTVSNDPLYNTTDSSSLALGSGRGSADVSIGSLRLFDYELKAEQFAQDQANTWQMKYIFNTV